MIFAENTQASVMSEMRNKNVYSDVHDLIHLPGPLTEDALLRALQARFLSKEYFVSFPPMLNEYEITMHLYN